MHKEAEEGIAAHWRYSGSDKDRIFDKRIAWLKQILEWKMESEDAKDFVESLKVDLFQDEIVVFTPKGDVIDLPENATPVDFAYSIHSDIGHQCTGAVINEQIQSLDTPLRSGDVIHIITNKDRKGPSPDWLKFVKTRTARSKIKSYLNTKKSSWLERITFKK